MNHLYEGSLFESLWSSFYHGMEGLQCLKHSPDIPVGEVESGSFLETFVPQFMPQDSDTDQLLGHLWEESGEEKKVRWLPNIHSDKEAPMWDKQGNYTLSALWARLLGYDAPWLPGSSLPVGIVWLLGQRLWQHTDRLVLSS